MGRWSERSYGAPYLTERETIAVTLYARGLTSKGIARIMDISPRTVENLVMHAKSRLGAKTIAHVVAIAVSAGLIEFTPETISLNNEAKEIRNGNQGSL